ncbi:MAG: GAF domain-containing protein [Anaerolineales bacterium]|nr:GAF domain-containing protein [Anaerolineales bacterium]
MLRFLSFFQRLSQVTYIIVLIYQLVVLAAFLIIPILAYHWLRLPFLGAFVEQTLVVNQVTPSEPDAWPLLKHVPDFGYRVVELDGIPLDSSFALSARLRNYRVGETVQVVLESPNGERQTHPIVLQSFPLRDQVSFLYIPYFMGLIYLGIGLWVFNLRRGEPAGRAFALFSASVALASGALFDLFTTHVLTYLWTFALGLAGGALFELTVVFPQEARLVQKYPYLRRFGYVIALLLIGYAGLFIYDLSRPLQYALAWKYLYIFSGVSVLYFLLVMFWRWWAARSPVVRTQARTILLAILFSFGPLGVWFVIFAFRGLALGEGFSYSPYLLLPLVILPIMVGYTIRRRRLLNTDFLVRQGTLYAFLTVLVVVGYALIVSGLTLIFGSAFDPRNPLVLGVLVFVLALLFNPLRNLLQHWVDMAFFRGIKAYEERLRNFSRQLVNTVNQDTIVRLLRQQILESLLPERLHIYVYDPLNDLYVAAPGEDGRPTSDVRFGVTSALARLLAQTRMPVSIDETRMAAELGPESTRLTLLATSLFVPMPGSERLIGWLALGERRSGATYTGADLNFLDQLSASAAVAIERAQVISSLERRVREMNILARVSQGVNVTVNFDDILELIYAQTNQAIPTHDFHITLYSRENDYYYYAFCLEKDERLSRRENVPLPPRTGLSAEVIRLGRPILTNDYGRECQQYGVAVDLPGIYAWLGVPLNAGAETIGALSIGSRDPAIAYTPAQMQLLQSLADQAAGAIVKARLLQETQRRAHQLTVLNEITVKSTMYA